MGSIETIERVIEDVYRDIHKDRAMWDLYYRSHDESAYKVLVPWQSYTLLGGITALVALFFMSYPLSLLVIFTGINLFYFLTNPFRYFIAYKGIRNKHRTTYVSEDDVKGLKNENLPVYTILAPLYKEATVLPHIMDNIDKMDYPKNKLDVKILLAEDDIETIEEARRPGLFGEPEAAQWSTQKRLQRVSQDI